jgi:hypothetical protein
VAKVSDFSSATLTRYSEGLIQHVVDVRGLIKSRHICAGFADAERRSRGGQRQSINHSLTNFVDS